MHDMARLRQRLKTLYHLLIDMRRYVLARLRKEKPFWRPHHYLHFELTPGFTSPNGPVHHNTMGFRGPDIGEKGENTLRFVCMGESVTYCPGLPHEQTYPTIMGKHLQASMPECDVEVVNAAVPGYNTAENLINFIFKIEPLKPDFVVFMESINDLPVRQYPRVQRDNSGFCLPWGRGKSIKGLGDIATFFRMQDSVQYQVRNMFDRDRSKHHILNHSAKHYEANLRDLIAVCRANKCGILLVKPRYRELNGTPADADTTDPLSFGVYQNRAAIDALARDVNVPVLDMVDIMPPPPWSRMEPNDYYLDSVHFSAKGAEHFGVAVANYILDNNLIVDGGKD